MVNELFALSNELCFVSFAASRDFALAVVLHFTIYDIITIQNTSGQFAIQSCYTNSPNKDSNKSAAVTKTQ